MQAIILAGGLSRRLGGTPKAGLILEGRTLLVRTVDAAARLLGDEPGAASGYAPAQSGTPARIAVVGPDAAVSRWLETSTHRHLVIQTQEQPAFSGPAAGLAAGLAVLENHDGHVLVLACDMPQVAELTAVLGAALEAAGSNEGVIASEATRRQPLAAIYPERALRDAVTAARAAHRLENASVFSLLAKVMLKDCAVPVGLTADIDTWEDARTHGIAPGVAAAKG